MTPQEIGNTIREIRKKMGVNQIITVRHYLAQEPEPDASRELQDLVNNITRMDKESFKGAFDEWYEKNKDIVNERVHDKRIKKKTPPYMRPKLRSAYLSVKRNMPLLLTFYDYPQHWDSQHEQWTGGNLFRHQNETKSTQRTDSRASNQTH